MKVALSCLPVLLIVVAALVGSSDAWSYSQLRKASQMIARTRRDPITMPTNTPMVPYMPPGADYAQFIDLNARFYQERTVFISSFIDEETANGIISILLYLRNEDPKAPMDIYLNVPGGHLRPSLAIYDLLCQTRGQCEITTINLGLCAGMGSFLCAAGTKGKRGAMPNSRFLLQRTGMESAFQGQATDIGLEVKDVKQWNDRMQEELAELTGQSTTRISDDLRRDFYLSSDEAVQYGLIDRVLLPNFNKRRAVGVEFGSFDGDDQKYQGGENKGGWGSRPESPNGGAGGGDKDDDELMSAKG